MFGIIRWFVKNPVAANLLMFGILAFGASSLLNRIVIEVFPEFESNTIVVTIPYPGSTPDQIEERVTLPAEEAVYQVEGIESMTSQSNENNSVLRLDVIQGFDINRVQEQIRQEIESISSFPDDVETPLYQIASRRRQVIDIVLYGDIADATLVSLAEQARDDLLGLGINYVSIESDRSYEIVIEVPEARLREYNLTLDQLAGIIRRANRDSSAGVISTSTGEVLLRTSSNIARIGDIGAIAIERLDNGDTLSLADIASIRVIPSERNQVSERFNQLPAVNLSAYRIGDESALAISEKVHSYVIAQQQAKNLPEGVAMTWTRDFTKVLKSRMELLLSNALYGGLLVILVLSLFLRPSVAFWVSLGIPISFMGGLAMMPILGISINMISMFAFILVLGIVVDDAIITGENIYSRMREGSNDAITRGAHEVSVPVIFGVLTTVVGFYPLATVTGGIGNIFLQIPAIVIPVLLFSLIESMLILPAHLRHSSAQESRHLFMRVQQAIAQGLEWSIANVYRPLLLFCLRYRYITLLMFLGISIITLATVSSGWIRFTFLPQVPSETLRASLTMPAGTTFANTDSYIARIEQAALDVQQQYNNNQYSVIESVLSVGKTTSGFVRVELATPDDRPKELTNQRLLREWRQKIGTLDGVEQLSFSGQIGRFGSPVSFQLSSKNIASMQEVSRQLRQQMAQYPNLNNIRDDFSSGKEEIQVRRTAEADALGISLDSLSKQIRAGFYGQTVDRLVTDSDEIQVILRYPEQERNDLNTLSNLQVRTDDGYLVPFTQVAELEKSRSPSSINRDNRERTIRVEADADRQKANLTVIRQELVQHLTQILQDYPEVRYKQRGESSNLSQSLGDISTSFMIALFVMYALLAIPLASYIKPCIVMSIIPFALSYAVLGHLIMGLDLSLMSIMGMIALSGVAINDALILVVFINRRKAQGVDTYTAVSLAGQRRFRPVLLTSMTTFFGLLPLMFETSTQAQFILPTGVSLGWGIVFTTAATLLLIPIFYLILEDINSLRRNIFSRLVTH